VVIRIISGGQTGVDRAGLELALELKIPHGGWCPARRWAEDGPIEGRFELRETPSMDPAQRTEWNVRDADATVMFSIALVLTGGSAATVHVAQQFHKPYLHLARSTTGGEAVRLLQSFLESNHVGVLNVAGPRASQEPEAGRFAYETLRAVLLSF
jgi:hypothetical protein